MLHLHELLNLRCYDSSLIHLYCIPIFATEKSIYLNEYKNTYPALNTKKMLKLQHLPLSCWRISNETTTHICYIGPFLSYWVYWNLADFFASKSFMQNWIYIVESFIIASAIKTDRQTFYLRFELYYQYCTQNHVS